MIVDAETIISNLETESLADLRKPSVVEEGFGMKVNKSALARKLNIDRRTVKKYIDGFEKSKTRNRPSRIDGYRETIARLLDDKSKVFCYKSMLYRYLKENHGLDCSESAFRAYISRHDEFDAYFSKARCC